MPTQRHPSYPRRMRLPGLPPRRGTPPERSPSRALLAYNGLRLVLLAACLGIGYLAGLSGFPLIVAALLVSGVLSFFLLKRQRIDMGLAVEAQVQRGRGRLAERTAREDAYADALEARQAAVPADASGAPPSHDDS
jgi:hypothetical protein